MIDHPEYLSENSSDTNNFCALVLTLLAYVLVAFTFPVSVFLCIKVVQEYERAVIFRLGRNLSGGAKGPGLFFVLPCIDEITTIDLRTITFDVPPQEILTKDSVTVTVDAVVYYRIFDPVRSVNRVANAQYSTRLLAATSLRNILGTKTLQEILTDKESIAHHLQVGKIHFLLFRKLYYFDPYKILFGLGILNSKKEGFLEFP